MIIIFNIISIILLLLNVFVFKNTAFGFVSFFSWLAVCGYSYKELINRFVKDLKFSYLIGILSSFYLLCFFGSIFTVLYKITPLFFVISLLITTILPIFFIKKEKLLNLKISKPNIAIPTLHSSLFTLHSNLLILIIGIVTISALILFYLLDSRTGDYNIYQFKNTFPLLWLLFSALMSLLLIYIFKFKTNLKYYFGIGILLTVFVSFLFHSTLPIIYKSGFGGDRLRHAATEKYLQEGNIFTPSLFGSKENVSIKKVGGLEIPEVFIVGNKQSYSNKWTGDIFISWIINKDVIVVDKYFIFIVWSLFLPILLLNIFRNFTQREDVQLFFIASSLFLSDFIIYGSISQPISFGLILFLLILSLFLNKIKTEEVSLKWFLMFGFISLFLLYFNYIVFLVIFLLMISFFLLFNKINFHFKFIYVILLSLLVPFLDLISGQTHILKQTLSSLLSRLESFSLNILSISELFKNAYDSSRNFLYFKFVSDIDKLNIPWIVDLSIFFTTIFFIVSIFGMYYFYKTQEKYKFLVSLLLSLLLSYFISFVCLDGVRIFTKRIEIVISFLLLIFFAYGILFIVEKIKNKSSITISYSILIVLCSLFTSSTLSSGPIMQNATESDFKTAKWLFYKVKNNSKYCIIGNTWPLLSLEYESSRKIVAGGFPQGLEFSQNERVFVFNEMIKNPRIELLEYAKNLTGADTCYFIVKNQYVKDVFGNNVDVYEKYKNVLKVFKTNKDIDDVKIFME